MQAPVLKIRKKVLNIQGRDRPCVQVLAVMDPLAKAALEAHFKEVNLFKRTMYANGFPKDVPQPEPELAGHLSAFVRDDACPEVSVKTLLAGQLYQAQGPWDMMAFEYIAKRAFDSLLLLLSCCGELGRETLYAPAGTDPFDMTFVGFETLPEDAAASGDGEAEAGEVSGDAVVDAAAA